MNKQRAYEILEINGGTIEEEELTRQYKKMALKYHPDKNKSPEATVQFQRILEAYNYIREMEDDDDVVNLNYKEVIYLIIEKLFPDKHIDKPFSIIIKNCIDLLETQIKKRFSFPPQPSPPTTPPPSQPQTSSSSSIKTIIIHPNIDDLLENNLYRLVEDDNIYILFLYGTMN